MSWREIRSKYLEYLGVQGMLDVLAEHGIRPAGRIKGKYVQCHMDDQDEDPSGSFNIVTNRLRNFQNGISLPAEEIVGNGDWREGFRALSERAGLSGMFSRKSASELKEVPVSEVIEVDAPSYEQIKEADDAVSRFLEDCCNALKSASNSHKMAEYLTETRGIPVEVAVARGMGLVSLDRLFNLYNELVGKKLSPWSDEIGAFLDLWPSLPDRLVWVKRSYRGITHLRFRGLPKPHGKNPKNTHTITLLEGTPGWFGDPKGDGPLCVTEGEFNILQANVAAGKQVRAIAVGSSSTGVSLAESIHRMAKDIIVIGDDDPCGRKMVQAIADKGKIQVIYPPDGMDADEYLKQHSWQSLLDLARPLNPSWNGFKDDLRPLLMNTPNEQRKDTATKKVISAINTKGRLVRTTCGKYLYVGDKT